MHTMQPTSPISGGPVTLSERIHLLDALRGFALFGVLLANLPAFVQPETTGIDQWTGAVSEILISTKFITLLSMLFGAGFYYQWKRLREQRTDFRSFYLKRMFWLFLIGSVHAHLLWFGDILRIYALSGALLLLFPLENDKIILRWSMVLVVPLTAIAFIAQGLTPYFSDNYPNGEEVARAFISGSYREVLAMNWAIDPIRHFLKDSVLTLTTTLGKMLLGVWLAHRGFFVNPSSLIRTQKFWIWGGLVLGLPSSITYWALRTGYFEIDSPLLLWVPFVVAGGLVLHAILYLTLFVRWFNRFQASRLATLLQNTGRMSLTNYLLQTVAGMGIFYGIGLGLSGTVNHTGMLVYGLVFFALQMRMSDWWLKHRRMGPVEWIWRKLAYRKQKTHY
jgi:uncharacterized protein